MRARRLALLALAPLVFLAACATVPPDIAESQCREEAGRKIGLSGTAALGYSSRQGLIQDVDVTISAGSNADALYTDCVIRKTGSAPTRPYWSR
jgi:hypothetical protein